MPHAPIGAGGRNRTLSQPDAATHLHEEPVNRVQRPFDLEPGGMRLFVTRFTTFLGWQSNVRQPAKPLVVAGNPPSVTSRQRLAELNGRMCGIKPACRM